MPTNKSTREETENLDNYLRLFKKVLLNPNLTLLQKIILSDVISFQIQGQRYYKPSAQLAKELGNYKPKTIQSNFQWLNDKGYLDCEPVKLSNGSEHCLREARVVNIEQWTCEATPFEQTSLVEKSSDHPLKMAWANRHKKSPTDTPQFMAEPSIVANLKEKNYPPVLNAINNDFEDDDQAELTIASQSAQRGFGNSKPQSLEMNPTHNVVDIPVDLISFSGNIRDAFTKKIAAGGVINYQNANVIFEDGTKIPSEVVSAYDDIDNVRRYTTRHYIETGEPT